MPLAGDAKREYQRLYMRKRVRDVTAVAAALREAAQPAIQVVAQQQLVNALQRNGLSLDLVLAKVTEKLEATTKKTIAKKATTLADNDAQLRAADLAVRLHERAGTIPAIQEQARGGTGLSVQINFVMPSAPQPVVIEGHAESHEHGSP